MTASSINTRLMTLHALTFLHPGTGQTTGVVDLPVQREVHTGFPMIASSGLKGSMREAAERAAQNGQGWTDDDVKAVFGPDTRNSVPGSEAAGALIVTDARILAFPVRSLQQVFLWVTCPMVLNRLGRDLDLIALSNGNVPTQLNIDKEKACLATGSMLQDPLVLEELRFELIGDADQQKMVEGFADLLAGNDQTAGYTPSLKELDFKNRLVIIHDEDFQHLARHATQVSARIALNEKKTTSGDGGNLWYEETLPPETVMYAVLRAETPRFKNSGLADAPAVAGKVQELLDGKYLQVGGNETVGQGWCQIKLTPSMPSQPDSGGGQS
ncbi:MAG: type III-B CRISPR module RAMP protein Cmr4 [Acidobacteria bacterium]|nr:type III-B CRISPR module RAMP protein Cmr4 [Acidobacteriota bacterium]